MHRQITEQLDTSSRYAPLTKNNPTLNVHACKQFFYVWKRSIKNILRDPLDLKMKSLQNLIVSLLALSVFYDLGKKDISGLQSRDGILFFITILNCLSSFLGSLYTFTAEKSIFLRERASNTYSVSPYYWAKSLAELPFQLFYPIVILAVIYYEVGLDDPTNKFKIAYFIMVLNYMHSSSYGLTISALSSSFQIAIAIAPIALIPLMIVGGFFANKDRIPSWLNWIQYMSMFKYGYQGLCYVSHYFLTFKNEYQDEIYSYYDTQSMTIQQLDPMKYHNFEESFLVTILVTVALDLFFRMFSWFIMWWISSPKKLQLSNPKSNL